MNIRARQIEVMHALLRKHHNVLRDLELNHFKECETTKRQHLESQHKSELDNMKDYNRRGLEDLRKQHIIKQRQQPRELKVNF